MGIGTNVVASFWTLINHVIAIFRKHPDPPTKITQAATEEEKLNDGVTEVEKINQGATQKMKITQEATEVEKITQEATTADFLPNFPYNTQLVTTHHDNVSNKAVSLNEAGFLSQSAVSPNNENDDNITNSSYEDSVRYQERSSEPEFIANDKDISLKRTDENDRKNNVTSDKYCADICLKDRIDWLKDKVQGDYANTCAIHCIYVGVKISQGVPWEYIQTDYGYLCGDENDDKVILDLINTNILPRIDNDKNHKETFGYKRFGLTKKNMDMAIMRCLGKKLCYGGLLSKNEIGKILDEYRPAIYFLYDGEESTYHVTLLSTVIKGNKPLYFNSQGGCDDLSLFCQCDKCREDILHILGLEKSVKMVTTLPMNNKNGDNITNSSYEDSVVYQGRSSEPEFIANDAEIWIKRTDENDRKNNLTSDKYRPDICLKNRIYWFKDKVQGDYANTCAIHCIYVAVKVSQGVSWEDIYKEYWCICWDQKKYRCSCCNKKDDKVILYLVNTKILRRRTDESPKGICDYYKKNGLIKMELNMAIKLCSDTYKNFYYGKLLNKTDIGKIVYDSPQAIYFVYHGQSSMSHVTLLINFIKGNRLLYFNSLGGCDELSTYCPCDNCLEDTLHKKQ
ncbi:hypothetical protein SNE40_008639 [Patella caerulea]|uniref:Uncharacterized protein n=1 Tax=Patella caerulea TaxID=87958 RepID=A0AAN8JV01_PATCE